MYTVCTRCARARAPTPTWRSIVGVIARNVIPFVANVNPFVANVNPFVANVNPFVANVNPFVANVK